MKKYLLSGTVILMTLASCESLFNKSGNEYLFKSDNGLEYKYSDFELYDSSAHVYYLKTSHPEFDAEKASTFSLLANGEEVCKGVFFQGYSSSLPSGPFISNTPAFYPAYTIMIDFMTIDNKPIDTRNDPRIISALEEHNLLHSGLSVEINSVGITGTQLAFTFTVTNHDLSDLLILDPDKTGPGLYHYFTNGLSLRKVPYEEVFSGNIEAEAPSPWDSWKIDWLTELKSGESKQYALNYTLESSIAPGEYIAFFDFPGLSYQVTKDQLFQDNKRIWLGDILLNEKIVIE